MKQLVQLERWNSRSVLYPSHQQVQVLHLKLIRVHVVQVLKLFENGLVVHSMSCRSGHVLK